MVELPKVTLDTDLKEGYCFGCGVNNPIGLKLKFKEEADGISAEYTPDQNFQGWPGLLHGGITATLLDEAMSNVAYRTGNTCLTAVSTIRIRQPIPVDASLVVYARVTRQRSRLIETDGKVCLKDGTVVAEATAKQFVVENGAAQGDVVREKKDHV